MLRIGTLRCLIDLFHIVEDPLLLKQGLVRAVEPKEQEAVRLLLGHSDIGSTARYLGAIKQPDHLAISRAYEI